MNLNPFLYFKVTVDEGSISKAAERLFISQPALSHFITNLERQMGVRLLYREKNRPFEMTPAGSAYLETCNTILNAWSSYEKQLEDYKANALRKLSIGLSTSKCPNLLARALPHLKQLYPEAEISMMSNTVAALQEGVISGKYDIAFSAYMDHRDELNYVAIFNEEVDLVLQRSLPLAQRLKNACTAEGRLPLRAVGDFPFAMQTKGTVIGAVCMQYCKQIGFDPNCLVWVETSITCTDILQASSFCGLIPRDSVAINCEKLISFPLDPPLMHTTGFYYRKGKPGKVLGALLRILNESLAQTG